MDEVSRLFTRVFFTLTGTSSETDSFRRIVDLGLPTAIERVAAANRNWFTGLMSDSESEKFFTDKAKFLQAHGGIGGLTAEFTVTEMNTFRGSVDAASLVFMHSALDSALHDLCRATAQAAPQDWEQFVQDRKARLADVRSQGCDALVRQQIDDFVSGVGRESVPKKTDRLFQVCGQTDYVREGYTFDRFHLEQLDRRRHHVVHGLVKQQPIADIEEALKYLLDTGLFFFGVVNRRYGLKLDPAYTQ